jgi:hypothetical protein
MRLIIIIIGVLLGILDLAIMFVLDFNGQLASNAFPLAVLAVLALITIGLGLSLD